jgi:dTDP-4-amino-4,6-dideoxygalactose transaminase
MKDILLSKNNYTTCFTNTSVVDVVHSVFIDVNEIQTALTSTVNSFIKAIVTVYGSVAELVEVNALPRPYALYVIQGTSHHHVPRTWNREDSHC